MANTARWSFRRAIAAAALVFLGLPIAAAEPNVVVTLKPLHGLVAAVMEGVGTPHLLIDGAASPHVYAMKPSEVRRLNTADVIIRVSKRLEVFLVRPLSLLSKQSRIVTIDDETPGLVHFNVRAGGDFEDHAHPAPNATNHRDHEHGASHATHGHDEPDHVGDRATRDPHLWLDPRNAKAIVVHLGRVLTEVYPSAAERLTSNVDAATRKLDALDAFLSEEMTSVAGRPFLVFHDAYQYFEHRYKLSGAGSVTVNAEVPPSARRISEIRARVARAGIVCIFAEPQFEPRVITAIAEGLGVRQATLDPLGASIAAGPGHYSALMLGLARDLKGCLGTTG
ncbi:MAG: zinc ABC transporter substrate-binding protein [Hyphomicrobiaceae bacterium]